MSSKVHPNPNENAQRTATAHSSVWVTSHTEETSRSISIAGETKEKAEDPIRANACRIGTRFSAEKANKALFSALRLRHRLRFTHSARCDYHRLFSDKQMRHASVHADMVADFRLRRRY